MVNTLRGQFELQSKTAFPNTATVTNPHDLNRDGRVNTDDVSIVRNNQQAFGIVAPIIVP